METSGLFNPAVRVKIEPCDVLLTQNNYETIDEIPVTENVKYERFLQENSTQEFQENKLDDIHIEMECTEMKPNLLAVAKIEDHSPNQCQDSDEYKTGSTIKLETVGSVKKEYFGEEETDLNFGRGPSEKNEKGTVSEEMNSKHRLKTRTESACNGNIKLACDVCRKSFRFKSYLQRHIDAVHRKIRQECDICQKTFSTKSDLNRHIDSVHKRVRHACDICGKTFTQKGFLKTHIDAMHNSVRHACDICQKTFSNKSNLRKHIDSVHNGVRHACDMCTKKFTAKRSLKAHIDAEHNGITHACDSCEKKFKYKTHLKKHVKSSHNVITHSCGTCGKTFGQKRNLRAHIDMAHRSRNQT
ncbi:zinc finger protein 39-like [Trichogramma pretiosum]|uniref:zinc finger protein 39-like n=1 Tax=Trichogramma pretiosum TaxID=7493 RepID=UPI000C71C4F9|nr:zinc finger protein 39-like [Trichogramma pretiosum]